MQQKKVPLRMCTGCMEHKPKRELVRVVKSPQGEIALDLTGKKSGRGAYLCNDIACLQKARKQKRLEKAFSQQIPQEIYEKLEAQLLANSAAQENACEKDARPERDIGKRNGI